MTQLSMGQTLVAEDASIPSSEAGRRYGPLDLFVIEGRYYRMLRLSFDDFHDTVNLLEEVIKEGSLPAAMAARVLPISVQPNEIIETVVGLTPQVEGEEVKYDPNIDSDKVATLILEKKREVFQTILTPLFGIARVRDRFNQWVAIHLMSVSSREEGAKESPVHKEDLKNPDIFPLDSFEEIIDRIFHHPDLRRFFAKVSRNPKIQSMMSTTQKTHSQSNGKQNTSQTMSSGDETSTSSGGDTN